MSKIKHVKVSHDHYKFFQCNIFCKILTLYCFTYNVGVPQNMPEDHSDRKRSGAQKDQGSSPKKKRGRSFEVDLPGAPIGGIGNNNNNNNINSSNNINKKTIRQLQNYFSYTLS